MEMRKDTITRIEDLDIFYCLWAFYLFVCSVFFLSDRRITIPILVSHVGSPIVQNTVTHLLYLSPFAQCVQQLFHSLYRLINRDYKVQPGP